MCRESVPFLDNMLATVGPFYDENRSTSGHLALDQVLTCSTTVEMYVIFCEMQLEKKAIFNFSAETSILDRDAKVEEDDSSQSSLETVCYVAEMACSVRHPIN